VSDEWLLVNREVVKKIESQNQKSS